MATRTWLDAGTSPGDWGSTTNWSGGAVPVSNDDVVIASGSRDITGSLNQSAVNLNSLKITSGYKGNIGGPGASLQINVTGASPTNCQFAMGGQFIYFSGNTAAAAGCKVDSTGTGTMYITGGTLTGSGAGTGAALTCGKQGNLVLTGVTIASGDVISCGMNITSDSVLAGSGRIADLTNGRFYSTASNVGTIRLRGQANFTTFGSALTVGTLDVGTGSTYTHSSTGTITTANVFTGGIFMNGGYGNFTVTTANLYTGSSYTPSVAGATGTAGTQNNIGSG